MSGVIVGDYVEDLINMLMKWKSVTDTIYFSCIKDKIFMIIIKKRGYKLMAKIFKYFTFKQKALFINEISSIFEVCHNIPYVLFFLMRIANYLRNGENVKLFLGIHKHLNIDRYYKTKLFAILVSSMSYDEMFECKHVLLKPMSARLDELELLFSLLTYTARSNLKILARKK